MRTFVALSLLLCSFSAFPQQKNSTTSSVKSPLVVGIVVDQMRYDFLHRYYSKYQEGGFKRLMNQGFVCHNHHYDYAQTVTAAGHASVYTGSTPSMHGIVGNEWFDRSTKKEMYCVADSTVKTVGSSNVSAGKMSPKNLLTTTITDQLHLATNFKAKIFGISLKDRGAILPAGHSANGAFWFDTKTGNWISSTFYSEELPSWVKKYNEQKRANQLLQEGWKTLLPIEQYTESEADDQPYESKITADKKSYFPYTFTASFGESFAALSTSPHGLTLTKELAIEAIKNENLGKNGTTDFLAVSFSSTDYVGHAFGPYSVETEDMYLRLDRDLAELLSFLDKWVGKDNFTVFLTADHGVMDVTDMWKKYKLPAGRLAYSDMVKAVKKTLTDKYGDASLYESSANYQLYFDRKKMTEKGVSIKEIHALIRPILMEFEGISDVILSDEIGASNLNHHLQELFKNGYHAVRSGDIQLVTMPGWIASSITATHGSTYNYDTHIPLIFYGAGVAPGKTYERTGVADTAPTLAAILKILSPSGTMGEIIPAVIK